MNKGTLAVLMLAAGTIVGCHQKSAKENQAVIAASNSHAKPLGWDRPPAGKQDFKQNLGAGFCIEAMGGKIVDDIIEAVHATTPTGQDTTYLTHNITVEMPDKKTRIKFMHAQNKGGCIIGDPEPVQALSPPFKELRFQ